MTKKEKQTWTWLAIAGIFLYFLLRPKTAVRSASIRYSTTGTMTPKLLAEMYDSLMQDTTRTFITDEALGIKDLPWQLDLARYTTNYPEVKAEYLKYYGKNLTDDLIAWLTPPELSDYVAALWKNFQAMTP
jgi:hypothetical protein